LEVQSFAFLVSFVAGTLPQKFPNETGAPKKENFPVQDQKKDWTNPEILCSQTPIAVGNFYGNILAQKKGSKNQKTGLSSTSCKGNPK